MNQTDRSEASVQQYSTAKDTARIILLFNDFDNAEKSTAEIAKAVDMHPSKASRMMRMLEVEGLFERNGETGKYRLGMIFAELGTVCTFNNPARKIIRPHVEQIAQEIDVTASWAILRNCKIISMDRIQKNVDLAPYKIGVSVPIHAASPGKVLLAYLPEEEQDRVLQSITLSKCTAKTIVDKQLIKEGLKQVRERGYAVDAGEAFAGLNCISVPIRNGNGEVMAAITAMDMETRTSADALFGHIDYLKEKGLFISRQLGY